MAKSAGVKIACFTHEGSKATRVCVGTDLPLLTCFESRFQGGPLQLLTTMLLVFCIKSLARYSPTLKAGNFLVSSITDLCDTCNANSQLVVRKKIPR